MYTAADLLNIARAEIGYKEKKSNANLDDPEANAGSGNFTKYSRDLYAAGYYGGRSKQGFAWCCCFVDWCHLMAAGGDKQLAQNVSCQSGDYGAACNYSAKYYRLEGRFDQVPTPGAQIYFGTASSWQHTGLVEEVDDKYVRTIEGNSGDGVVRKQYLRTNSKILGYGHPYFGDDPDRKDTGTDAEPKQEPAAPSAPGIVISVQTYTCKQGSKGNVVVALQALLNAKADAGLDIDGAFGPKTRSAVLAFQTARGLEVDGVAGRWTWDSLINGGA